MEAKYSVLYSKQGVISNIAWLSQLTKEPWTETQLILFLVVWMALKAGPLGSYLIYNFNKLWYALLKTIETDLGKTY